MDKIIVLRAIPSHPFLAGMHPAGGFEDPSGAGNAVSSS
jgi:hypothetical protein